MLLGFAAVLFSELLLPRIHRLFMPMHLHHIRHDLGDPVEIHRYGLAGRNALLLLLGASLATFVFVRIYTRLQRRYRWRSGELGGVHVHHMVVGVVIVLAAGMADISLQPGDTGRAIIAVIFGIGGAFILDEFALTFHLRDVYWTEEGRRSIEASVIWLLLGALLLVGVSPFGIHDKTVIPRTIGFSVIAANVVLSVITCLKGKLTLGLVSVFLPPVGLVTATRLARPGSVWAELFYRDNPGKRARAEARFHPEHSHLERLRIRCVDLLAGAPNPSPRS
jgi:lysyl-tRNA synthetase, class II